MRNMLTDFAGMSRYLQRAIWDGGRWAASMRGALQVERMDADG
ncbi:MAG TPA: hypothetical protein VMD97_03310 [Candidatus Aquilonibacter sp.]|nr:hypothetical protein [Candidatus Aquilonibacter sp.]